MTESTPLQIRPLTGVDPVTTLIDVAKRRSPYRFFTPNQLVAARITELRRQYGWTQAELATRLERTLGQRWSIAVVSAAERSVTGSRVREFSADELVALARAFDVPIGSLFLMTTGDPWARVQVADQADGLSANQMFAIAMGGSDAQVSRRAMELAKRTMKLATEMLENVGEDDRIVLSPLVPEEEATK